MKFIRAVKYGFCAGVRIADKKVKKFARAGGKNGQILGQVVHNERVVDEMAELGVPTIESLDVTTTGTVVFSAHGVPPSFHDEARDRGLRILDTTCPFVYDIHDEADAAVARNMHLVFIGKPDHREVIGYTHDRDPASYHVLTTLGEAAAVDWRAYAKIKVLYQSTLNAEEYEDVVRYIESQAADVSRADTICYATKENQDAVRELGADPEIDVILVIGGRQSANTRHLWELGRELKPSYLVHDLGDLEAEWFEGVETVGITAGASTPDYMIDEVENAVLELCTATS
ncbi:MAG: 4-hydroxy-3-methylbut-2-enyl diphosphate reductase [Acidobacteria bacterium]|nr:4-hydroxy-3-methylbut-2-enyl diphosphate reductase [Acidobacteriota bacterium]